MAWRSTSDDGWRSLEILQDHGLYLGVSMFQVNSNDAENGDQDLQRYLRRMLSQPNAVEAKRVRVRIGSGKKARYVYPEGVTAP